MVRLSRRPIAIASANVKAIPVDAEAGVAGAAVGRMAGLAGTGCLPRGMACRGASTARADPSSAAARFGARKIATAHTCDRIRIKATGLGFPTVSRYNHTLEVVESELDRRNSFIGRVLVQTSLTE